MSNRSPEVTIMVPSYNSVKYIDSTILSVIAQKHKNWELLAFDDNSDGQISSR